MDWFSIEFVRLCDAVLKGGAATTGLWLVGLLIVRTNARGRWRIVGLEWGPVFDPKQTVMGKRVGLAFVVFVALIMLRTFAAIV